MIFRPVKHSLTYQHRSPGISSCNRVEFGLSLVEQVKLHEARDFIGENDDDGSPAYPRLRL